MGEPLQVDGILFAVSWPLLDLSVPKRAGVHADLTSTR